MKRLLASLALALALGCSPTTRGSGVSKTEARPVAAFSEVAASTGLDVVVHVGAAASVSVTGDDNIVPLVETEVSKDRLRVAYKPGQDVHTSVPLHVDVTLPALRYLSANSGCHVTADGIKADAFVIHATSGADATVSGTATTLAIDVTSGVRLDAGGLASGTATLHATSGASVTLRATESVKGDATSGSSVRVLGAPRTREVSTSSGASVAYE
jgi:Putative auto-transporter adhesin, head GIN domain